MSLHCVNPGCFQGDPGNPPEYVSDAPLECAECHIELDADEDEWMIVHMDNGSILCHDCGEMCAGSCGEWITGLKAAIRLRCRFTGKLESWCVECAAEDWLERLMEYADEEGIGDGWPAAESLSRLTIGQLYAYYQIRGKAHQEFAGVAR